MKKIEIISHIYGVELPLCVGAFQYHLSSLILHRPKCSVTMTVCYCPADKLVCELLEWFSNVDRQGADLKMKYIPEETPLVLGRRCIGRNKMAKQTEADVVWFADGDFCFGDGCLDTLACMSWPEDATLVFPREYWIHKEHAVGDRITRNLKPGLVDVDPEDFIKIGHSVAIGGIQIVTGDFCREHGYLDKQDKWMQPHTKPFKDTLDDKAFRKYCGKITGQQAKKIDLPNLFRIRQSVNARG